MYKEHYGMATSREDITAAIEAHSAPETRN